MIQFYQIIYTRYCFVTRKILGIMQFFIMLFVLLTLNLKEKEAHFLILIGSFCRTGFSFYLSGLRRRVFLKTRVLYTKYM